jgi:two-component system sensor histidine kinase/response regulator
MTLILIVDDEVQTTTMLEKILSMAGYETIAENKSSNAMKIAKLTNPDLFILDLMMPEPDGFKLCRMLRADLKFTHTPILIVTALSDGDSQAVAYGAGATDYLIKPYEIAELKKRVKALVGKTG